MPTIREQILEQAKAATLIERQSVYGPPQKNWNDIAKLQTAWRELRQGQSHTALDAIIEMILIKLARLSYSPDHFDSWLDIAGYAAIGAEIADAKVPGLLYPTAPPRTAETGGSRNER